MIDAKWNIEHGACYTAEHLHLLYPTPKTLKEVLTCKEGAWSDVPVRDRLWVFTHVGSVEWSKRAIDRFMKHRNLTPELLTYDSQSSIVILGKRMMDNYKDPAWTHIIAMYCQRYGPYNEIDLQYLDALELATEHQT